MNPQVKVWQFYKAILEQALSGWSAVEAYLILDSVMVFGDRWQIFRVSLQHGHRAIPLAWTVEQGKEHLGEGAKVLAKPRKERDVFGGCRLSG